MASDEATCARHAQAAAIAACSRCGVFVCADCGRREPEGFFCRDCLERPEVRLTASPRAKRALWLALVGLHGVLVLLPVAWWLARAELQAIEQGQAPEAGRAWVRGAKWACGVAAVVWAVVALAAW